MQKKLGLQAAISGKCPRCREGDMFSSSIFHFRTNIKMNKYCPNCELRFEVEPGFFFGAMYISYVFSVALVVSIGMVLYWLGDPELWTYILIVSVGLLLFYPAMFRYSRILFLHIFGGIRYNPEAPHKTHN